MSLVPAVQEAINPTHFPGPNCDHSTSSCQPIHGDHGDVREASQADRDEFTNSRIRNLELQLVSEAVRSDLRYRQLERMIYLLMTNLLPSKPDLMKVSHTNLQGQVPNFTTYDQAPLHYNVPSRTLWIRTSNSNCIQMITFSKEVVDEPEARGR